MYLKRMLRRGASGAALAGAVILGSCTGPCAGAQELVASLPDAPFVAPASDSPGQTPPQASSTQATPPATAPPATPATTSPARKATDEEVRKAEKQRILGIVPEFNAVLNSGEFRPLTPKQKFGLMFKSSTDPFIFLLDGIVSGIGQAKDSNPGFGQGLQGYAKRYGSSYADTFDGNFWGNAVLPTLMHEDPRYFRKGTGSFMSRFLYSAATTVWCRRDTGKWGPNYANVLGNLIAGGISNAYYPDEDRGYEKTFSGAATVTAEGVIGAELIEFSPDISHHFFKNRYRKMIDQQGPPPPAAPVPSAQPK